MTKFVPVPGTFYFMRYLCLEKNTVVVLTVNHCMTKIEFSLLLTCFKSENVWLLWNLTYIVYQETKTKQFKSLKFWPITCIYYLFNFLYISTYVQPNIINNSTYSLILAPWNSYYGNRNIVHWFKKCAV